MPVVTAIAARTPAANGKMKLHKYMRWQHYNTAAVIVQLTTTGWYGVARRSITEVHHTATVRSITPIVSALCPAVVVVLLPANGNAIRTMLPDQCKGQFIHFNLEKTNLLQEHNIHSKSGSDEKGVVCSTKAVKGCSLLQ